MALMSIIPHSAVFRIRGQLRNPQAKLNTPTTSVNGVTQTMAFILRAFSAVVLLTLAACQSTTSTTITAGSGLPQVAIVDLNGSLGSSAADLISQQLAMQGVAVAERAVSRRYLSIDTDLSAARPASASLLSEIGRDLGVSHLFAGSVRTETAPLSSFPHVFMTLRLVDVNTAQSVWIGQYGNQNWTSAISTQGDLQRGAEHLVREFKRSGGSQLIR